MARKTLQFKVPGGLKKVSEFYLAHDGKTEDLNTYWHDPAALLKHFTDQPVSAQIKLSEGYKKLADTMDTVNFDRWIESFEEGKRADDGPSVNACALTSLWHSVSGYDAGAMQLSGMRDKFNSMTVTILMMVTVTITVTITVASGSPDGEDMDDEAPGSRSPGIMPPVSKLKLQHMTQHAQIIADHIGWFS